MSDKHLPRTVNNVSLNKKLERSSKILSATQNILQRARTAKEVVNKDINCQLGADGVHERHHLDLLKLEIVSEYPSSEVFLFVFEGLNKAFFEVPLSSTPDSYEKRLFMMSYAYAARSCSAGLFCQGQVSRDFFMESQGKFQEFQLATEHSIEFQEKAAAIALKLLQRYDQRLTKSLVGLAVAIALNPNTDSQFEIGSHWNYEFNMDILMKVATNNG